MDHHFSWRVGSLNFLVLMALSFIFIQLFANLWESLRFLSYFFMLFVGGVGILLLINCFDKSQKTLINLILALFVGIIANYLVFIVLRYFKGEAAHSPYIIFLSGLALIFLNLGSVQNFVGNFDFLKDKHFFMLILVIIFSLFLISDKLTYTEQGLYVHDPRHPTTELSFAQSVKTMFPVNYLSYNGDEFRYHFGYPIITYQLVHDWHIDELKLVYNLFPSFMVIIIFLLLYGFGRSFITNSLTVVLFCIAVLLSTLSLPASTIIQAVNAVFKTATSLPENPIVIFTQLVKMGGFALAIIITLLILIIFEHSGFKSKQNYFLKTILLWGLAVSKITFFIIFALAYTSYAIIHFLLDRNIWNLLTKGIMLVPGVIYFLLFISGAHPHNLWAPFPGSLNIDAVSLSGISLFTNAGLSLISALIIHFGIGWIYLCSTVRSFLQNGFCGLTQKIKEMGLTLFYLLMILFSYLLGVFTVEVTEGNNRQFLFVGYIVLSILTYRHLFTKKMKTIYWLLLGLLIILNLLFLSAFFIIPTIKLPYHYSPEENNLLANLKLGILYENDSLQIPLQIDCLYSNDLIAGLRLLAAQSEGIFLLDVIKQSCENYPANNWEEIVSSKNSGFIRTAVSGKQTLVEHYKFKGALINEDYCKRVAENIAFYGIITGQDKDDFFNDRKQLFLNSPVPAYHELSYYPYFKQFSDKNYYTYNEDVLQCIAQEIDHYGVLVKDNPRIFLRNYLIDNQVAYILFERGEFPLSDYLGQLGLSRIYDSDSVQVYAVNG